MSLATTEDTLLGGAMLLRQPARGYRLTSDAVLLAALTPLKPHDKVLELGTGYGQVALCLLARDTTITVTGLELMPLAAQLARENASLNHVVERFHIVEGDVAHCDFSGFDLVVSNPPYRQAHSHTASEDPIKAAATTERVPLQFWCNAAAKALNPGGVAVFIHDARRQQDLVGAMQQAGLANILVLPLLSKPGQPPNRVIVRASRGAPAVRELEGFILHNDDGSWVPAVESALRGPHALSIWPD